ncbi:unnamed protein product [Closterium sp. NIES-54]
MALQQQQPTKRASRTKTRTTILSPLPNVRPLPYPLPESAAIDTTTTTTQEFKLYNGKGGLYIGKAVLKNTVFVLDFVPDQGTVDSDAIVSFTTWSHPPDLDPDFSPGGFWYSHTIPEAERTRALAVIQQTAAAESRATASTSAAAETTAAAATPTEAEATTTTPAPIASSSSAPTPITDTTSTPTQ